MQDARGHGWCYAVFVGLMLGMRGADSSVATLAGHMRDVTDCLLLLKGRH